MFANMNQGAVGPSGPPQGPGPGAMEPMSSMMPMTSPAAAGSSASNAGGQMVPVQNQAPSTNQVSLSVLIEYLVQRVYHELNVLAELLPRKTDMERKVMIFQVRSCLFSKLLHD